MKAKSSALLDIEKIFQASEDSQMNSQFLAKNAKLLERLANRLGISREQATLFAIIACSSYCDQCSLTEIQRHLDCKSLDMLRLTPDLKALQQSQLIRAKGRIGRCQGEDYYVPEHILNCLLNDTEIEKKEIGNLDFDTFILQLDSIFKEKEEKESSFECFVYDVHELIAANQQLDFAQKIGRLNYDDKELVFFLKFCLSTLVDQEEKLEFRDFDDLFDTERQAKVEFNQLRNGQHRLITDRLVEPAGHELFGGESFRLTEHAKETLLPQKYLKQVPVDLDELKMATSIAEKRLFYNANDQAQVERLKSLLQPDSFSDIRLRMKKQGMRSGFACLLYGTPGTGKQKPCFKLLAPQGEASCKSTCRKCAACGWAKARRG